VGGSPRARSFQVKFLISPNSRCSSVGSWHHVVHFCSGWVPLATGCRTLFERHRNLPILEKERNPEPRSSLSRTVGVTRTQQHHVLAPPCRRLRHSASRRVAGMHGTATPLVVALLASSCKQLHASSSCTQLEEDACLGSGGCMWCVSARGAECTTHGSPASPAWTCRNSTAPAPTPPPDRLISLGGGVEMPVVALGTGGMSNATAESAVKLALANGMNHIHTGECPPPPLLKQALDGAG
jgi:hypothetical protein